jgi:hypothetical protein
MFKKFLLALLLSASMPAFSTPAEQRITGDIFFGCVDKDYFSNLVHFAVQKDTAAFSKGITSGVMSGNCTLFKQGEKVYMTDISAFSGLKKVRREGDIVEFWTNIEAAK